MTDEMNPFDRQLEVFPAKQRFGTQKVRQQRGSEAIHHTINSLVLLQSRRNCIRVSFIKGA